jgi:hypothetical protein
MLLHTRSDRPVDPLTVDVLRLVDRVLNKNAIRYFIGGASARDLLLSNVLGFEIERAIRDIDFAIAAPPGHTDACELPAVARRSRSATDQPGARADDGADAPKRRGNAGGGE